MFVFLFLTYFTVYCYRGSRFIHTLELTSNELLFMADYSAVKIAGGGMKKRERSCTVDENVNGYKHYGEQHGDSLKQ